MLRPPPGSERARVIGLLDAFQAAERAGAEAVGCWIVACADARLGELVRRAEGDAETHALLETIVDDERVSVRWLRGMRDALEREEA